MKVANFFLSSHQSEHYKVTPKEAQNVNVFFLMGHVVRPKNEKIVLLNNSVQNKIIIY